ncbi:hypothetical protein K443DRAFT_422723 [Laccaria amethystina LaAM-08-1]|uniref:Uncharacterized protein n=1 Tax=Laccaria amethystina LaAM-08-1 TaxID=1095629 RepID=A0A0C9WPB4_9AGAR|nr:hypothetical protein K443DRAFT_422723 [Laccaria amethystina LaAM-08-1]
MSSPVKIAEGYAATEMVKLLLEIIIAEISDFKRFKESSRQVVATSIEVFEAILRHIADIDKKKGKAEGPEWMKFREYTDAIASLEDLLLHCTYCAEEQESLLPIPRTTDVPSCLKVIDIWASDREITLAIIHKFEGDNFKKLFNERSSTLEKALREALKNDDKELILSIQKFVSQPGKRLSDEAIDEYMKGGERPVSNVKQLTESVVTYLAQNYSENTSHVIKIILLVYFPFALFEMEGTDPSWLEYLASKRVWDEMYKALNDCINHLKHSNPSAEAIGERYRGLAKTLFTMAPLPPLSFETQILEMMQIAKHVRRPFSGRSSVLVFTWSDVATNRYILEERAVSMRRALRKSLSLSLEILKHAAEQLTSSQRFEDAAEVKAVGEKFERVFRDMNKIYEHYKMADKWSQEVKPQLEDASRLDTERYDRVRSRVYSAKASRAVTPATPKNSMVRTVDKAMTPELPMGMSLPSRMSVSELPSRMSASELPSRMPESPRSTDSPALRSDRRLRRP